MAGAGRGKWQGSVLLERLKPLYRGWTLPPRRSPLEGTPAESLLAVPSFPRAGDRSCCWNRRVQMLAQPSAPVVLPREGAADPAPLLSLPCLCPFPRPLPSPRVGTSPRAGLGGAGRGGRSSGEPRPGRGPVRSQQGSPPLRPAPRRRAEPGAAQPDPAPLRRHRQPPTAPSPRLPADPTAAVLPRLRGCGTRRPGPERPRAASARRGSGRGKRDGRSGSTRPGWAAAAGRQKAGACPPLRQRGLRGRCPSPGRLRQGPGPLPGRSPAALPASLRLRENTVICEG